VSTCPMPTCQTTAGCVCDAAAQFGPLDLNLIRIAYLEDALREIAGTYEATEQTPKKMNAALYAVSRLATHALQKSETKR
jgi:hypothetical protein